MSREYTQKLRYETDVLFKTRPRVFGKILYAWFHPNFIYFGKSLTGSFPIFRVFFVTEHDRDLPTIQTVISKTTEVNCADSKAAYELSNF